MATSSAVQLAEFGNLSSMSIVEGGAPPAPGAGEVVVAMKAASLNYRDYLAVSGKYSAAKTVPLIPCSDGAGVVVSVGVRHTMLHTNVELNFTILRSGRLLTSQSRRPRLSLLLWRHMDPWG